MSAIQVMLVDDHEMMRQGLRAILEQEDDIQIVGEAGSGEALLHQVQSGIAPDVVLMDLQMKGMSGVEATKRLKTFMPGVQIVGLSALEEDHAALAMHRAGAFSYVVKSAAAAELVQNVRAAHALGLLEGLAHLAFHEPVVHPNFLFLQQLLAVHRHLSTDILAVLPRGVRTLVGRAFGAAPDARSETAAQFVFGTKILAHIARVIPFVGQRAPQGGVPAASFPSAGNRPGRHNQAYFSLT